MECQDIRGIIYIQHRRFSTYLSLSSFKRSHWELKVNGEEKIIIDNHQKWNDFNSIICNMPVMWAGEWVNLNSKNRKRKKVESEFKKSSWNLDSVRSYTHLNFFMMVFADIIFKLKHLNLFESVFTVQVSQTVWIKKMIWSKLIFQFLKNKKNKKFEDSSIWQIDLVHAKLHHIHTHETRLMKNGLNPTRCVDKVRYKKIN
jgi:hypothetical protein